LQNKFQRNTNKAKRDKFVSFFYAYYLIQKEKTHRSLSIYRQIQTIGRSAWDFIEK